MDQPKQRFLRLTGRGLSYLSHFIFNYRPEEIGIVEGMWMMYGHDEYWLFYSAANFQLPTYRMMVARSKDLMGPYVKGDVPVVETDWERLIFGHISPRP